MSRRRNPHNATATIGITLAVILFLKIIKAIEITHEGLIAIIIIMSFCFILLGIQFVISKYKSSAKEVKG